MPYNVDKKMGGDSEENTGFMEKCVSSISGTNKKTGKPYTKGEKIAICKTALKRKKESNSSLETFAEQEDIDKVELITNTYLQKLYKTKRANSLVEAEHLLEVALARCDHNIDYLYTLLK